MSSAPSVTQFPLSSGSSSYPNSRMLVSACLELCARLASLSASPGMITTNKVSIFTILPFNTIGLILALYATESDGLHCVLCSFSCSINSSTERTRIEEPQAVHLDCRKKTSFCTTGFRVKSNSLNSIHHSFGRHFASYRSESPPALEVPQYPCQEDFIGDVHSSLHVFKRLRDSKPVVLLPSARSGNRLSRH